MTHWKDLRQQPKILKINVGTLPSVRSLNILADFSRIITLVISIISLPFYYPIIYLVSWF